MHYTDRQCCKDEQNALSNISRPDTTNKTGCQTNQNTQHVYCTMSDTQRGQSTQVTLNNRLVATVHNAVPVCYDITRCNPTKCLQLQLAVVVVALTSPQTSVHELGHKHAGLLHIHLLCCLLSIWCCRHLHQCREDPVFYVATNAFNTHKRTLTMTMLCCNIKWVTCGMDQHNTWTCYKQQHVKCNNFFIPIFISFLTGLR